MQARSAAIAVLRGALTGTWVVVMVGLLGLAAWSHLATVFVVRGASMEPTIPIGSIVTTTGVASTDVAEGDVLVFRSDNGMIVTHRVVRVVDRDDGRYFEMKGDANASPDPALVAAGSSIGRVALHVPRVGYVVALLSTVPGLVSVLVGLAMLLVIIWWLDELDPPANVRRELGATRGVAS
jgi:signal peptidase I